MTREERAKDYAEHNIDKYTNDFANLYNAYLKGAMEETKELEKENAELKEQIEKLIDFVISKTECCDVCPITDTCINSEGTCPYAGILAKNEEVTREWLMQFILRK